MGDMILELSADRVKLLKKGLTGKQIEKVFVVLNDYKVIDANILYDVTESGGV